MGIPNSSGMCRQNKDRSKHIGFKFRVGRVLQTGARAVGNLAM